MATEWYCDQMGKVIGPMSASQLLAEVKAGKVSAGTLVRKDNSKWFPAAEVGGLFEAAFGHRDTHEKRAQSLPADMDY